MCAPSILPLLQFIKQQIDVSLPLLSCPPEWSRFICALSCPSPVCAWIHPTEEVFDLLHKISLEDITVNPVLMSNLQQKIPVLFQLLRDVHHLPKRYLTPLFDALIEKSNAPFLSAAGTTEQKEQPEPQSILCDLACFPCLPLVRNRQRYDADCHSCKTPRCTKQSSGHPSLLPGIFTLFRSHGKS